jgi:hypothetical protein
MHLVPCGRPLAVECTAPRCSLENEGGAVRWDSFWGADDLYYARATHVASGEEHWYRIADDMPATVDATALGTAVPPVEGEPVDPSTAMRIAVIHRTPRAGAPAPLVLIGAHRGRRGRTVMWIRPARA